jgi:hypothetical protein
LKLQLHLSHKFSTKKDNTKPVQQKYPTTCNQLQEKQEQQDASDG